MPSSATWRRAPSTGVPLLERDLERVRLRDLDRDLLLDLERDLLRDLSRGEQKKLLGLVQLIHYIPHFFSTIWVYLQIPCCVISIKTLS